MITNVNLQDPTLFKFWCQKVLPLVYDDSLSYYEVLCKVVDKINNELIPIMTEQSEAIETLVAEVNSIEQTIDDFSEEFVTKKLKSIALILTGDATIGGNLNVDGGVDLNSGMAVKGVSTFDEKVTMKKDLDVKGDVMIDGYTNLASAEVDGDLTVDGALDVGGNAIIGKIVGKNNELDISNNGEITISGDGITLDAGNSIVNIDGVRVATVNDIPDLSGKLDKTGGTITGNLEVNGNLTEGGIDVALVTDIPDISGKYDKTGGTISGDVSVSGTITDGNTTVGANIVNSPVVTASNYISAPKIINPTGKFGTPITVDSKLDITNGVTLGSDSTMNGVKIATVNDIPDVSGKLDKTGGTITGDLEVDGNLFVGNDEVALVKDIPVVDDKYDKTGGEIHGNVSIDGDLSFTNSANITGVVSISGSEANFTNGSFIDDVTTRDLTVEGGTTLKETEVTGNVNVKQGNIVIDDGELSFVSGKIVLPSGSTIESGYNNITVKDDDDNALKIYSDGNVDITGSVITINGNDGVIKADGEIEIKSNDSNPLKLLSNGASIQMDSDGEINITSSENNSLNLSSNGASINMDSGGEIDIASSKNNTINLSSNGGIINMDSNGNIDISSSESDYINITSGGSITINSPNDNLTLSGSEIYINDTTYIKGALYSDYDSDCYLDLAGNGNTTVLSGYNGITIDNLSSNNEPLKLQSSYDGNVEVTTYGNGKFTYNGNQVATIEYVPDFKVEFNSEGTITNLSSIETNYNKIFSSLLNNKTIICNIFLDGNNGSGECSVILHNKANTGACWLCDTSDSNYYNLSIRPFIEERGVKDLEFHLNIGNDLGTSFDYGFSLQPFSVEFIENDSFSYVQFKNILII